MLKLARRPALALAGLALISSLAGAQSMADVYVVHGIRGEDLGLAPELPVDISVDGNCLLSGFEFGTVAGPVQLAEGTYEVEIRLADPTNPCGGAVVFSAQVPFTAGENATVIAHLDEAGGVTASKFENDLSPSAAGSRVQFHHTAAAPAVDIRVPGMAIGTQGFGLLVPGVTSGQQAAADLPPGSYRVAVALAGTRSIVLGPLAGKLGEGRLLSVYVVGSASGGTLTVLAASQELP